MFSEYISYELFLNGHCVTLMDCLKRCVVCVGESSSEGGEAGILES